MDNALQQYLQQKNQLASPDQLNAPLLAQQQQPDDSLNQLAQSQQQLQNALQAYKQGRVGGGAVSQAQAAFAGQCQKWAEEQTYGHAGIFPSATAAWGAYAKNGQAVPDPTLQGAKQGDLVYLQDPNQPNGHVGVYNGNGNFTSATYNGVKTNNLGAWTQGTGQKILGYVRP